MIRCVHNYKKVGMDVEKNKWYKHVPKPSDWSRQSSYCYETHQLKQTGLNPTSCFEKEKELIYYLAFLHQLTEM
jgi:hypothetical protein